MKDYFKEDEYWKEHINKDLEVDLWIDDYKEYLRETFYDKKNIGGTINFIFLSELGKYMIYKVTEEEIKEKL